AAREGRPGVERGNMKQGERTMAPPLIMSLHCPSLRAPCRVGWVKGLRLGSFARMWFEAAAYCFQFRISQFIHRDRGNHDFLLASVGSFYVWWLNQGVTTAHAADVQKCTGRHPFG